MMYLCVRATRTHTNKCFVLSCKQKALHTTYEFETDKIEFSIYACEKFLFFLCSFNKLLLQKEELEQKHVHLLQVVESEKTAKWQYTQQCEELSTEIKKLRNEVSVRTTMPRRLCLFQARFIAQAIISFLREVFCTLNGFVYNVFTLCYFTL